MSPVFGIALYFVIWWTVLFAILPFGVRSQYETGQVVPGSEGAAPARPMLLRKMALTTIVSAVVFGVVYLFIVKHIVPLDWFPFGPRFDH